MNKQSKDISQDKFAFIAPSQDCASVAMLAFNEINESVHIAISGHAQALEIARSMAENGIAGIICSTAVEGIIRAVVDIPIQSISPSSSDIARKISMIVEDRLNSRGGDAGGARLKIGISDTLNIRGIEWVEGLFGVKIDRINFTSDDPLSALDVAILDFSEMGENEEEVSEKCESYYYVTPGAETVLVALKNLKSLVNERSKGASDGYRFKAAMQFLQEGLVVFNNQGSIDYINQTAEKMLGEDLHELICGDNTDYAIPISDALNFGHTRTGQISHPRYSNYWYRVSPMTISNERIGAMLTIFDMRLLPGKIEKASVKKSGFTARYLFSDYLTENENVKAVIDAAKRYAAADSPLLITGETGTGKEIIAQSVHNHSVRATGPFVAVNFAALAESLVESELFGYEAGSFTGARKEGKPGFFEQAEGGTIFLDEIGEVPLAMQARLLRVVQERVVMRVGGTKVIPINVRLISATHRNLLELIEKGQFRRDLYHRLNVLQLRLLPLSQRSGDLPLLIKRINEKISARVGRPQLVLSEEALRFLAKYSWPGNIRELENLLERLLILKSGEVANAEDVAAALDISADDVMAPALCGRQPATLAEIELEAIKQALARCGSQEEAARSLGISATTIWRKLRKCKLQ